MTPEETRTAALLEFDSAVVALSSAKSLFMQFRAEADSESFDYFISGQRADKIQQALELLEPVVPVNIRSSYDH